jgi:hypothetical protein
LGATAEFCGHSAGEFAPGFFRPVHGKVQPALAHVDPLLLRAVFGQPLGYPVALIRFAEPAHGPEPEPFDGAGLDRRRAVCRGSASGPDGPGHQFPAIKPGQGVKHLPLAYLRCGSGICGGIHGFPRFFE